VNALFKFRGFLAYSLMIFLNAFVDLGHKIVVQNTVFKVYDGQTQIILTAVVNALILLPFILLFSPAGFLSDKYPRPRVMQASAAVAVVVAVLITLSYYMGWFWCAFALTFVLAIQSAVYSPAKYGYIREMVGDNNLAQANGWVQAVTIVAILSGTFVFSGLFEALLVGVPIEGSTTTIMTSIAAVGWVLIALALVELFVAFKLPLHTSVKEEKSFSIEKYMRAGYLRENIGEITAKRTIWLSIVGLSMFWAISQVVLASFPAFAKETLSETNTVVIQGILACTGIGIMAGSLFAARASKNYIELGLIPIGASGVAYMLGVIPMLDSRVMMALSFIVPRQ
jgi:acyl-[acyl-carrier-protein]-phospholipid O-acyltransferase/long-chain-fatty-acid--[acyl-carrier-protein] ligase